MAEDVLEAAQVGAKASGELVAEFAWDRRGLTVPAFIAPITTKVGRVIAASP